MHQGTHHHPQYNHAALNSPPIQLYAFLWLYNWRAFFFFLFLIIPLPFLLDFGCCCSCRKSKYYDYTAGLGRSRKRATTTALNKYSLHICPQTVGGCFAHYYLCINFITICFLSLSFRWDHAAAEDAYIYIYTKHASQSVSTRCCQQPSSPVNGLQQA